MTNFQIYQKKKSLCKPWLQEIPQHWRECKLKYLFKERSQKGFPTEPLLAATQTQGVVTKKAYGNRTVEAMKDLHLLKLALPGDFVISLRSFQGGIEYTHDRGIISPAYTILIPSNKVAPSYFRYLFKSLPFLSLLKICVTGIREGQNINYNSLKQINTPLPPYFEQEIIGRFLDYKCAQINKFIQKKKRLIELLKEQKQVIINQAVTRGLDPNVRFKPSGVEWLGDIPEHWKISRLRNIATVRASGVDKHTVDGEPLVLLCNYVDVYKNSEITDQLDFMKASATPAEIANFKLLQRDVIITKDSEDWKDIGIPAYVPQNIDNLICGYHLSLIRPYNDLIDGRFLYTSLLSEAVADQFRISATGVTRFGLSQGSIKDVQIPLPPLAEQKAISEYVKIKNEFINQVIARTQKEIHLIQEYRTRLISDVVTGQLDVRNIEITDIIEEERIEDILEEDQEEESLELIGAGDDD